MKRRVGEILPETALESVTGVKIMIPDPCSFVHLQFRRCVGCPICNTHIGQIAKRADEIEAAGIKEILFFHSHPEEIRSFQSDVNLIFVADPSRAYYREYGVESSFFYLSIKALAAALSGMVRGKYRWRMTGGPWGLPADFLISNSGRIVALKYGKHAYDQWSVDELLSYIK